MMIFMKILTGPTNCKISEMNTSHMAIRNLVLPNLQTTLEREGLVSSSLFFLVSLVASTSSSQILCMRSAFLLASSSPLRGRMSSFVRPVYNLQ